MSGTSRVSKPSVSWDPPQGEVREFNVDGGSQGKPVPARIGTV